MIYILTQKDEFIEIDPRLLLLIKQHLKNFRILSP